MFNRYIYNIYIYLYTVYINTRLSSRFRDTLFRIHLKRGVCVFEGSLGEGECITSDRIVDLVLSNG